MKGSGGKNLPGAFLAFVFLSLVLLFLDSRGFLRGIKGAGEELILPVKEKLYELKNAKTERLKDDQGAERKIAELEVEIGTLKAENASMRRLLGAPLPSDWRFLPARVIGETGGDILEIDKGRQDNLREGMVVVLDNYFIGRIFSLGEHFAKVRLPLAEESRILASVRQAGDKPGESALLARGIVFGQGSRMNLEQVLLSETLKEGDWVVTTGDETTPQNLILGKVGRVNRREGEIFQSAEVAPLLTIRSLENVFVVTHF